MAVRTNLSTAELLSLMPEAARMKVLSASYSDEELAMLRYDWRFWARPSQVAPDGDWIVWLLLAGRGFGKTRTGASWVHEQAMLLPGTWIAMIANTPADARDYMIEGPGGIMRNTLPSDCPDYEPSKRRLTWKNGSWATIYSSQEADQLRGFSGGRAWVDEFAKYGNPRTVWDNLQFGMREGDRPRILITTTPRPLPILTELRDSPTTVCIDGNSYENRANLSPVWFTDIIARYEGTALGRQEIHGQILDAVQGQVYSSFSRQPFPVGNVDEDVQDIGGELLIGQDFNVNPMATVVAVRVADECHVLDALEFPLSNTEQVCAEITRRYPNRKIIVCPDPSGKARKTNAPVGVTDFTIMERAGWEIHAPVAAPLVVDRVNNTQAMLCQGDRRRVRIHPRAKPLIRALAGLTYKEGSNQRDKASGYDHICDALDYLLWEEFNVLVQRTAIFGNVNL